MIIDAIIGSIALACLILPGWLLAKRFRIETPLLAAFIISLVSLMMLLLVFDVIGVPLRMTTIGAAWGSGTIACWALWRTRRSITRSPSLSSHTAMRWTGAWLFLLPLVPAITVVAYRAFAQPLFGVDTIFRWNHLAEQMTARGTLNFYPPVTPANYEVYGWPDGIPPCVAALYFWCYSVANATRTTLTAPAILLQFALLLSAVFALARRLFSKKAAMVAMALIASTPIVLWSVAMGQESGLAAISLVAMLLYLPRDRSESSATAGMMAGACAALGSLSREYGLAWTALGLLIGIGRGLPLRSLASFSLTALLGGTLWYIRNWIKTGNPLFNLDLGNWFPVNQEHTWLMESYQQEFGWSHVLVRIVSLLGGNAAAVVVAALIGGYFFFRRVPALLVTIALIIVIWATSISYTAAGVTYSLRVLTPGLALAAILGGAAAARYLPDGRHQIGVAVALVLLSTDAALRALVLPSNVYRLPVEQWLNTGRAVHEYHERPIYHEIAQRVGSERLLILGPATRMSAHGARTVPLWSPEVRYLFSNDVSSIDAARRLRAAGIGYFLLTRSPSNARYIMRCPLFREPGDALPLVWSDDDMLLMRVDPTTAPSAEK